MRLLTLIVLSVFSTILNAQDVTYQSAFEFNKGDTARIFNNWTRVRSGPYAEAEILDSLPTNTNVIIKQRTDSVFLLGTRQARWYEIFYTKNNIIHEGFLWGSNLCLGQTVKNGYDILFGISKNSATYDKVSKINFQENLASVKVMSDQGLVDEYFFKVGTFESVSAVALGFDSVRLKNVDFVIKALTSGEACGIASYDQYLLFTNQKLVALPILTNVGDADLYHYSENFYFTRDRKNSLDKITLNTEQYEKDETTQKEKTVRKKTVYTWDGKILKKI